MSEGTTKETTVSITDDDVPSVTVSFEKDSYTVAEGSTVNVKVTLSADPERTVTIPISTTNQDPASDSDYSGVPDNLTFVPGDTEETISFTATDDDVHEDDESVKLTFGNTLPIGVYRQWHNRSHGLHHRRRRPGSDRQLREGLLHRGRGQHRHRQGDP